jgi:hypothetical protein
MPDALGRDLLEAFCEVLAQHLPNWSGASQEPEVMFNRQVYSISRICGLVELDPSAEGEMPDHFLDLIRLQVDSTCPPLTDRTFRGGARYVLDVIDRRKRHVRYRDERLGRK